MTTIAQDDSEKREPFAVTTDAGYTLLHWAAIQNSVGVIRFLIPAYPQALLVKTSNYGEETPLQRIIRHTIVRNGEQEEEEETRSAEVIALFTDSADALSRKDYPHLAVLTGSDSRTSRCAFLAVRTTLLLCIKHGYVYAN